MTAITKDLIPANGAGGQLAPAASPAALAAAPAAAAHVPMSFGDVEQLARYVVGSRMFGIDRPEQAIALMMLCHSEGLHPMQAVRRYHLINGRPTMRADAMLAEFQSRGGRVEWHERSDVEVSATFFHPLSGTVPVRWTYGDAERAGLLKNGTWRQYPRQMLTARVISEGVRTALPAVVAGIYTPEEAESFTPLVPGPAHGAAQGQGIDEGPRLADPPARRAAEAPAAAAPEAPKPAPSPEEQEARRARMHFAKTARDLGYDVARDEDPAKQDASKVNDLYDRFCAVGLEVSKGAPTAAQWEDATRTMQQRHAAHLKAQEEARAKVAAEQAARSEASAAPAAPATFKRETPEPQAGEGADGGFDDLDDPFAEHPKPAAPTGRDAAKAKVQSLREQVVDATLLDVPPVPPPPVTRPVGDFGVTTEVRH